MEWKCPDCRAVKSVQTPKFIQQSSGGEEGKEGKEIYLLCKCETLLFMRLKKAEKMPCSDAWGIPKKGR